MIRFLDSDQPLKLRARWVFPVAGPPLEGGLVEMVGGRIVGVSTRFDPHAVDLGNVALIPGLINAHTHLELSDCPSPLWPRLPFTEWIRAVLAHRRSRPLAVGPPGEGASRVVRQGALDCGREGTTCLGDIVGADWRPDFDPRQGPFVVAFREILGLHPERIPSLLEQARDHLALGRPGDLPSRSAPVSLQVGLSPHAPYSVHPDLLHGLVSLASEHHAPVAMHLAETTAELQLLAGRGGEFVEFLKRLGAWHDDAFRHPRSTLDSLRELARAPRGLVVHGNFLTPAEIAFLEQTPHLTVVYCPRTHAGFQHPPHPWRTLRERGIAVAIGTDSRASNPDLSLWHELQFLRRLAPEVSPAELLELGTLAGARALGLEEQRGALTPGRAADLAIIELPAGASADPHLALFDPASRVKGTVQRGHWSEAPLEG